MKTLTVSILATLDSPIQNNALAGVGRPMKVRVWRESQLNFAKRKAENAAITNDSRAIVSAALVKSRRDHKVEAQYRWSNAESHYIGKRVKFLAYWAADTHGTRCHSVEKIEYSTYNNIKASETDIAV